MGARMQTPFTNEHFAAFCEQMVGQPYWFGTCGYKATTSLLKRKTEQYPSHYGSSRTSQYKQDIANRAVVCDCIGAAKGYAWTDGGQAMLDSIGEEGTIDNKYGTNNCPDKGANSMFSYAKSKGCAWGGITTLPEIVGLALHKEGHVGFYIGNGYAISILRLEGSKRSYNKNLRSSMHGFFDDIFVKPKNSDRTRWLATL